MEIKNVSQISGDICTGCAACMNCCPVDAIEMKSDLEGFLCPKIDIIKCIDCGKCAKICPVLKESTKIVGEPKCYAAWSKDENIRYQSSSGGIFTHLAQTVIAKGGVVVGARYRNDNLVEHVVIRDAEGIEMLRRSKYVQSEIGFVFREIKNELSDGKLLLFAGTPCQCAGLRAYLEKDYDNLILCDFICRGVNSPLVYLAYLHELEEKYGSKAKRIWFKNKTFGWNNFATKVIFENGEEYIADRETDSFMLGFNKSRLSMYMRKSCYQCRFKGVSRPTDITLADFWGVERALPDIDTKNGISAVMIHSEKGNSLWNSCIQDVNYNQVNIGDISSSNRCIIDSAVIGGDRAAFFNAMASGSFTYALKASVKKNCEKS